MILNVNVSPNLSSAEAIEVLEFFQAMTKFVTIVKNQRSDNHYVLCRELEL